MRIQTQFLWINIIGGIAVLGGYIFALLSHPETRSDLWGGVPIQWRALLNLLLSSASIWIHTTYSYIDSPTYLKWAFVQVELWITALSILLMTIGLVTASGVEQPLKHNLSILGLSLISFHCLVLDAMLWINRFPRSDL